jgi:hypothetical protein
LPEYPIEMVMDLTRTSDEYPDCLEIVEAYHKCTKVNIDGATNKRFKEKKKSVLTD